MQYSPRMRDLLARGLEQITLQERAAEASTKTFGPRVFVRAVVEVSNYCRENCCYCGMRRDNHALARARACHDEIAEILIHHRPAIVTDVNIQSGEDPVAVRTVVVPLLHTLRRETNLGLSVCLGTLDAHLYAELQAAGASVYVLKFETADTVDYGRKKAPGSLPERLDHIRWLSGQGWKVSSGFIAGLPGQSETDLLNNCSLAGELPVHGCSVSPFVPGEYTPLTSAAPGDVEATLNCMAILRLMRPGWVIPAVSALNLAQAGSGYRRGLRAGANLVTVNLTPTALQRDYILYKRNRFIMDDQRVLEAITAEDLAPSTQSLAEFYREGSANESIEQAAATAT